MAYITNYLLHTFAILFLALISYTLLLVLRLSLVFHIRPVKALQNRKSILRITTVWHLS